MTESKYCTAADVVALMPGTSWGTGRDDILNTLAVRASRLIDKETNRMDGAYYISTTPTVRYFVGDGTEEVDVDEMCSSPSVVAVAETGLVDDNANTGGTYTTWASNDYFTWPSEAIVKGRPITRLIANPYGTGSKGYFPRGFRGIKITGWFGFSITPPELIKHAACIQVVRWFKRGQQGFQDVGAIEALNQLRYVKKLDPDLVAILEDYRRVVL